MAFSIKELGSSVSREAKWALLAAISQSVSNKTGMRWEATSWIRQSPGHYDGDSLDIAPRFLAERHRSEYSRDKGSDPVLFRREALLRRLMALSSGREPALDKARLTAVVAVENDHLHIQLGMPSDPRDIGRVVVVPFGRDMSQRYADSGSRIHQPTSFT